MNKKLIKGKIEFFEKFGQMLNSGVPLAKSLLILSEEVCLKELKKEVKEILNKLDTIEKANEKFYQCFNDNFFNASTLAMLRAGEAQGQLDYVCIKIANCLRAELQMID